MSVTGTPVGAGLSVGAGVWLSSGAAVVSAGTEGLASGVTGVCDGTVVFSGAVVVLPEEPPPGKIPGYTRPAGIPVTSGVLPSSGVWLAAGALLSSGTLLSSGALLSAGTKDPSGAFVISGTLPSSGASVTTGSGVLPSSVPGAFVVTFVFFFVTLILTHVFLFFPSLPLTWTVILALPVFLADSFPFLVTFTTFWLEDWKVTFFFDAAGFTKTFSFALFPFVILNVFFVTSFPPILTETVLTFLGAACTIPPWISDCDIVIAKAATIAYAFLNFKNPISGLISALASYINGFVPGSAQIQMPAFFKNRLWKIYVFQLMFTFDLIYTVFMSKSRSMPENIFAAIFLPCSQNLKHLIILCLIIQYIFIIKIILLLIYYIL